MMLTQRSSLRSAMNLHNPNQHSVFSTPAAAATRKATKFVPTPPRSAPPKTVQVVAATPSSRRRFRGSAPRLEFPDPSAGRIAIVFPQLDERLAAQEPLTNARCELAAQQARLNELKAKAAALAAASAAVQREVDAVQRVIDRSVEEVKIIEDEVVVHGGFERTGGPGAEAHRHAAMAVVKQLRWIAKLQARAELAMAAFR